ncbi:hypothetical protein EIP86_006721 [Pleurotus ostreatoroseus]|nr:hypothetical protein EIP86_006721 [Pleurotus ostreatoroseus]
MDIKFIGSGEAAKAILYYITNYITKSQLKTHVAYAALELAVRRLAIAEDDEDDDRTRAKKMLRKCAFALLTHQEMSAQQVALYLTGHEGRFSSHEFQNLYWPSYERYLDSLCPSPECYVTENSGMTEEVETAVFENGPDALQSALTDHMDLPGGNYPEEESECDDIESEGIDVVTEGAFSAISDEVTLGVDDKGMVVPRTDQVSDYVYRAHELDGVSVWEFVAYYRKFRIRPRQKNTTSDGEEEEAPEDSDNEDIKLLMDNMQLLHECKDSGIDHFRNRAHLRKLRLGRDILRASGELLETSEDLEDVDILQHVEQCTVKKPWAENSSFNVNVMGCMRSAEQCGLYDWNAIDPSDRMDVDDGMYCEQSNDTELEKQWEDMYTSRRDAMKKKAKVASGCDIPNVSNENMSNDRSVIQTLADAESRTSEVIRVPEVVGKGIIDMPQRRVSIEDVVMQWSLNEEQGYAFRIIANHVMSDRKDVSQLRMFISGPGGTGKSRVINALRDFFDQRGESRRFRLASFTGVAAKNIGGMTLHSALCMTKQSATSIRVGSKTHQDLVAMWEGVDYLFVDEVSMLGCRTLAKVSEALSLATGKSGPFGVFCTRSTLEVRKVSWVDCLWFWG